MFSLINEPRRFDTWQTQVEYVGPCRWPLDIMQPRVSTFSAEAALFTN